jgi:hypothetical protein
MLELLRNSYHPDNDGIKHLLWNVGEFILDYMT